MPDGMKFKTIPEMLLYEAVRTVTNDPSVKCICGGRDDADCSKCACEFYMSACKTIIDKRTARLAESKDQSQ